MIANRSEHRQLASALSAPAVVGIPLACVWALHAAGTYVPDQQFVMVPLVLASSAILLLWRSRSQQIDFGLANKSSLTIALSLWFVGAALSLIINWNTPQVLLTDVTVFGCGAAVFLALSGLTPTPRGIDIAIAGLAAGSLLPLIGGLQAFVGEWGVPDVVDAASAYQTAIRMTTYEEATFGSRGNTAAFLVILTPLLLSIVLDRRKPRMFRVVGALTLIPVGLNLIILQSRAAFITLFVALAVVWVFRFGARHLPVFALGIMLGWVLLIRTDPDLEWMISSRFMPVLTADAESDLSVAFRLDAMAEGWQLFLQNWLVGIGPGAATTRHSFLSAHQFQVQQAMETGILGLVGSGLLVVSVWSSLIRTMVRRRGALNDMRFLLLIGPASYVLYAVIGNAPLATGTVNVWTVLPLSMLALAPPFEADKPLRERRALAHQGWRPPSEHVSPFEDAVSRPAAATLRPASNQEHRR